MMKTRIRQALAFLLAVIMMFSTVVFTANAAVNEPTVSVGSGVGTRGSTVSLPVTFANNPGVAIVKLKIDYDGSALELVGVEDGRILGVAMHSAQYTANPYTLYWSNPTVTENFTANGTVATLKFKIKDNAEFGRYSVNISYNYVNSDIINKDFGKIEFTTVNGNVEVIDFIYGDVDGDGIVTNIDSAKVARYLAGWEGYDATTVNLTAADVDGDGVVTNIDSAIVARHLAGWQGYEVLGNTSGCEHNNLTAVEAKAATCTVNGNVAYWQCNDCDKYFNNAAASIEIRLDSTVILAGHNPGDEATCTQSQTCEKCGEVLAPAKGHTQVPVFGYAPTAEKEGLTDGAKCSVCNEWIVMQEVIDKLSPEQYSITYILAAGDYIDQGDAYLQRQSIANPNPTAFTANDLIQLEKLSSPGYTFDGWLDQTGKRWDVIPVGTTQNLVLYAKWTQNVYTVSFDTPDVYTWDDGTLVSEQTYTIDTGLTLKNLKAYKYTFVGWSNDEGFIVDRIKPGTAEDITLHANWTSDRNRATSYSDYGEPIIIEDNDRGQFLFVYDIGKIDNVPLYTYTSADGTKVQYNNTTVDFTETSTLKTEFKREDAQNVAKTVANATTRSSGWTLSEEWESVVSESESDKNKQVKSEERTDSKGETVGNSYFISNSEGGSSYSSVESGSSSTSSAKITTEDSFGIKTSYDKSTEKYCDAELKTGFKNETELSAGISAPVGIAKVSAGVKNTTTVTADAKLSSGRKDNEAFHVDTNSSSFVGTDFSSSSASHYNAVTSNSTNWNSTNSYETSSEMSKETTVAAAIAQEIENTTTYNISNALSKAKDNTESVSGMTSDETGYSNSVTVSEYFSEENVYVSRHTDNNVGYHRLVEAGIVHVYAVVGYDIATASYYTYTFNVLEDDTYSYWDYSISDPSFKDCENGLITFEIPYEVNEYIAGVIGQTSGLEIGIDDQGYGCVNAFEIPNNFDGDVVVPQYLGVDNLDDTYDPVVVTSFSANAFRGNEQIKTVILPMYITEIPAYAFEGCTNLETVIAYGVTEIGEYAFKECVNLGKIINNKGETEFSAFMLDNKVTTLGEGAFTGVNELKVMAYDSSVADAAMKSGAKKITIDLTKLEDNYNGEKTIGDSTEFFKIIGGGKTFDGLKIKSDAKETFISNLTLTNNTDIPLELSSETVTLARVKVENAPGFALSLTAENTDLKLYQTITLSSQSENAVLSRNVSLSKANSGISGKMVLSGNYVVCGIITNSSMLECNEIVTVDEDGYNSYFDDYTITLDAGDGNVSPSSKTINYGQIIGTLPTPTRAHYKFLGWYDENDNLVTENTLYEHATDITLYARWALNEFTVTFNANGGSVNMSSKTIIYGNAYGTLPIPTKDGYNFDGWYNQAGNAITGDSIVTQAADHVLTARWTAAQYTITFYPAGGGNVVTTKTVTYGQPIGNLPVYNRDYYTFNGWYIWSDATTSHLVTADTIYDWTWDIALFAEHMIHNSVSDWVPATDVPAGAEIVDKVWRYTRTQTTESTSSSLSGWNQIGSGWEVTGGGSKNYASFPSGYDTNNQYYKSFDRTAYSAHNDGSTKREVSNTWTGYIYWHWMYNVSYVNSTQRAISHRSGWWDDSGNSGRGFNYQYFTAIASSKDCPYLDKYYCCSQNLPSYNCSSIITNTTNVGTPRMFRFSYYTSTYTDYQMVYQYEKITTDNESSTEVFNGGEISNVQKYVRYRAK